METHTGAKFQKKSCIWLRRYTGPDGRTNGTEFQGPIPPSSGDQKGYWVADCECADNAQLDASRMPTHMHMRRPDIANLLELILTQVVSPQKNNFY